MNFRRICGLFILVAALAIPNLASAQILYDEPFDSSAADVTINQTTDTIVTYVDYSNFTVGTSNFSIPEAPRPVTGGAATRGMLMQANLTSGVGNAVNVLAGSTPINFAGGYILSFDAYISVPNDVTAPFPTSGSTEQLLWGVGTDNSDPLEARSQRLTPPLASGTWGQLAGENGYSTEDAAYYLNEVRVDLLGDTQLGQDAPFNAAFDMPVTPNAPNNAPANQWVEVDVVVANNRVSVQFNGVEFFNQPRVATDGFAMLGYEDPFGSIAGYDPNDPGANPNFPDPFPVEDYMWGLYDNFTLTVPEPSSLGLILVGLVVTVWSRRRR